MALLIDLTVRHDRSGHQPRRSRPRLSGIPAERLEKLLLQTVVDEILNDARVATILDDCRDNMDRIQTRETSELTELVKARAQIDRKLTNIYQAVEEGNIRLEASHKGRLNKLQNDREAADVKIADLKVKVFVPKDILEGMAIGSFASAMRAKLADATSAEARAFLRLFVDGGPYQGGQPGFG